MDTPYWTTTHNTNTPRGTTDPGRPHSSDLSHNNLDDNNSDKNKDDQPPLATPTSFPAFPYPTPYAIQTQFMQQLFQCIDQRKIGIFESPTGTGKSLSMICGAVSWLMEHERVEQERALEDQKTEKEVTTTGSTNTATNKKDDTPDWVQQHRAVSDATFERQERDRKRQELEERVQRIRDKEKKMRESIIRKQKRQAAAVHSIGGYRPQSGQPTKKKKDQDSDDDELDDGTFLVDDYDSDDNQKGGSKGDSSEYGNVSKEVLELLQSFDAKEAAHNGRRSGFGLDDEDQEPDVLKIFYCSRTHSQLSQFVDELRKTSYGEHLHVVSLGSRKSLCINDKFRKKASTKNPHSAGGEPIVHVNKLNDACLEAQKSGTPSEQRCEFLHTPSFSSSTSGSGSRMGGLENEIGGGQAWWKKGSNSLEISGDEKLLEFRDHTLARIRDIEELAQLGSELETCPYYGSRQTVRHCQLVTLPYNLLLHSSTRESLRLVVKNNILLLDEAHNLINSLLQMHSVAITLPQVVLAQDQLRVYLARYESRLSSANEGYIRVLMRILKCLETFVESWRAGPSTPSRDATATATATATTTTNNDMKRHFTPADRVMKVNEFLHAAKMDHINLFKAHAYLETSGVARKLQGLHESLQRREAKKLAKAEGRVGNSTAGRVKIHPSSRFNSSAVGSQPTVGAQAAQKSTTSPILLVVDAFLMSLLNADNDGRVIVAMEDEGVDDGGHLDERESSGQTGSLTRREKTQVPVLKFMLLNPANVFKPLVEEARSVVLAGGTMEPVSDLLSHLFPYLKDPSVSLTNSLTELQYPRIHRFSCGHVIPKENLMAIVLEKSALGSTLELNFANRNQDQVIDGIGQSLANLLNMIPDGVVVFFVSYSYMAQVLARWQVKPPGGGVGGSATVSKTIMEKIQARKRVFVEPREATDADRMLKEYQECIEAKPEHDLGQPTTASVVGPRGAVLFSVVGGKMSEGINFSDRLGRGVIMVGMPFPNKGSPELQERMRYMDQVQQQELLQSTSSSSQTPVRAPSSSMRMTAGSEYYENLCMRAVNQSIGRAIRHQGDYAVIILMDRRYGAPRIRKKLPGWIGSSLEACEQFGPVMSKLSGFFRQKRTSATSGASPR